MVMMCLVVIFSFMLLRLAVIFFNFISNPKLPLTNKRFNDKISILIPARNEKKNILTLLNSIVNQDYVNYEVIILDDNSTDGTYELCSLFAGKHPNVRVLKGKPLIEGWLGKNYACFQLAKHANGKYLLFLDADVQVKPGLLNSAVNRMEAGQLTLLSLFTNQQMVTTGEKMVVPLMYYMLFSLLPIRLIYTSNYPPVSAACGQFMLFNAAAYAHYQWHDDVKHIITEDLAIMKNIKTNGLKGEALMANGLISCRMYGNFTGAIDGFSKNFLSPFNNSIPLFSVYLLVVLVGPLLILSSLNGLLISVLITFIMVSRLLIAKISGGSIVYDLLLHPLQMISLLLIGILAVQRKINGSLLWKGRRVQ